MPGKNFFNRSAVVVARELLGKYLCRLHKGKITQWKITETEAYEGFKDKASHASRGKTERNTPMFDPPGTVYVYFTYGMHWMLNIVCGPKDHPAAVLIREVTSPPDFAKASPGKPASLLKKTVLSGPGKLTKYLGIDKKLNGKKLGRKTGLWVEDNLKKEKLKNRKIIKTPRIGVAYAGPVWANKKYRFLLKN